MNLFPFFLCAFVVTVNGKRESFFSAEKEAFN